MTNAEIHRKGGKGNIAGEWQVGDMVIFKKDPNLVFTITRFIEDKEIEPYLHAMGNRLFDDKAWKENTTIKGGIELADNYCRFYLVPFEDKEMLLNITALQHAAGEI